MDIQAAYEFAKCLRDVARRSENEGRMVEDLIYLAEKYEDAAEKMEMDMIVQMQKEKFLE